jgi:chitin disaccharide deacetylase
VIVVADDLGADALRNGAIVNALEEGLVDAASVIVNGQAFQEAAVAAGRFDGRIGVHLVLTEGVPLTAEIRRLRRFCDREGIFRLWRGGERAFRLGADEKAAVATELRAQVELARASGFRVAHLDSHHHVHTEPAIAGVVIALARELGVPRVRLARNCGAGLGPANRAWKAVYNSQVRRAGLAGTRWFGNVDDCVRLRARRPDAASVEVMVHPVRDAGGRVVDDERPQESLRERLAQLRRYTE